MLRRNPLSILITVILLLAAPISSRAGDSAEQGVLINVEPISEIQLAGGIDVVVPAVSVEAGEIVVPAGNIRFSYSTNSSDQILVSLSEELPPGIEVRVRFGAPLAGRTAAVFTLRTNPQIAVSGIRGTAGRDIPVAYEIVVNPEAERGTRPEVFEGIVTYTLMG